MKNKEEALFLYIVSKKTKTEPKLLGEGER